MELWKRRENADFGVDIFMVEQTILKLQDQ